MEHQQNGLSLLTHHKPFLNNGKILLSTHKTGGDYGVHGKAGALHGTAQT